MLADALAAVVGEAHVLTGDDALADHSHDEALSITWRRPCAVVRPGSTAEVSAILRLAAEGAPVVSFARMNRVLEIDTENHDLTQLIVGSEGTLALVTEVTLRLYPRLPHQATVLAPFPTVDEVAAAVPKVVASGVGPLILEYLDTATMDAITRAEDLELGLPDAVRAGSDAYLLVRLESGAKDRLDTDVERLGTLLAGLGATDAHVLPGPSARRLVEARERAFWTVRAVGAADIVDVVVSRAAMPEFLRRVGEVAERYGSRPAGCGHAGDGNVHLPVFEPDDDTRHRLLGEVFRAGRELDGPISGEHGVGRSERRHHRELTGPATLALLARAKAAFDPHGILNPDISPSSEDTT
ncbi:MAG: FAD-binding protein [Pseudonocardia sp.]|uniref:FAD-binding oxidoreductase n=1 Tax=Pseudonocardia sp. TaxID=60912 RepID=UPI00263321BD|nr:FAD-binding oxidoreductase [Pseudonocardia sp.]MCU1625135.1 FAD-binding protein [Pseudonocardia sp.]